MTSWASRSRERAVRDRQAAAGVVVAVSGSTLGAPGDEGWRVMLVHGRTGRRQAGGARAEPGANSAADQGTNGYGQAEDQVPNGKLDELALAQRTESCTSSRAVQPSVQETWVAILRPGAGTSDGYDVAGGTASRNRRSEPPVGTGLPLVSLATVAAADPSRGSVATSGPPSSGPPRYEGAGAYHLYPGATGGQACGCLNRSDGAPRACFLFLPRHVIATATAAHGIVVVVVVADSSVPPRQPSSRRWGDGREDKKKGGDGRGGQSKKRKGCESGKGRETRMALSPNSRSPFMSMAVEVLHEEQKSRAS
ncbi:hypothetical protein CDD83_8764 [Cordyceps sp. RAO-2017]|nr:hypothetical protein CDD83_8764 [Cordyceps sp. RAO-2017]